MENQLTEKERGRVLDRDGYECRFCGMSNESHKDEYGRGLSAHHIIKNRSGGSNNRKNLITVCESCHKTLESTQADALERLQKNEYESSELKSLRAKNERLKEELESAQQESDRAVEFASDISQGIRNILDERVSVTLHAVHESRFNTSRLLYIGTDEDLAWEAYQKSDYHTTLETASVDVELFEQMRYSDVIENDGVKDTIRDWLLENGHENLAEEADKLPVNDE